MSGIFYSQLSWLSHYPGALEATLKPLVQEREELARKQSTEQGWSLRATELSTPLHWYCDQSTVHLEAAEAGLSAAEREKIEDFLRNLIPWKKGPFRVCGTDIDAEWRSDLKWQRLKPAIGSLKDHKIADIGCNNGYFMFRMLEAGARHVLGFEPFFKHWYSFRLFQDWLKLGNADLELLGVEHIDLFPNQFDTIFCLGILYHHTDPVGLLRKMRQALVRGGQLIIDCQGIAGDEPTALVPASRYAGARGIWFLPTLTCLQHWIRRAGFQQIETIFSAPLDVEEQRSTAWAPIKSLSDFLDPNEPNRTIEGYPAPWRFYLRVR